MNLQFVVLLSLACSSLGKISDQDIEEKVETVLRELELLEREESGVLDTENRGLLDKVEDDQRIREQGLMNKILERKNVNKGGSKSSTITKERRKSSQSGGKRYDADALQRCNTQRLHKEKNDGNGNSDDSRRRRKRSSSTSCYDVGRNCTSNDDTTRSADGSCNNLDNPILGMAGTPMARLTTNTYEDGTSTARTTNLPSARRVSTKVHRDDSNGDFQVKFLTHMTMQWGQFLAHDYASTPTQTDTSENEPTCCVEDLPNSLAGTTQDALNADPLCLPIIVPDNDDHFTVRKCLQFVRSVQADPLYCDAGHKEQLNAISTFIDASNVYGSTDVFMDSLRTKTNGMLITSANDMLPIEADGLNCVKDTTDDVCFKAGDLRVNVQMGLLSMHTIFVRFHNNIASTLHTNNPLWDDETLFQAARKIVGALMQHITYNEWLPIILGVATDTYNIKPTAEGFDNVYDSSVDPRITTEYATAAGRFGHSMIQSEMTRMFGSFKETTAMSEIYGRTKYVTEEDGDGLNRVVKGLVTDQAERADDWYSTEVTNRLFESGDQGGTDLAALNIQRGRDHGIGTYNDMREFCGLSRATVFDNSTEGFVDHREGISKRMGDIYGDPDDVDLYTGGVSEDHIEKGQVGPLFACLIGKQFEALKKGDRFYYENDRDGSGFTLDQLNAIKKVTLSRIICDNTDLVTIPENPFELILNRNRERNCTDVDNLPKLDLTPWTVV